MLMISAMLAVQAVDFSTSRLPPPEWPVQACGKWDETAAACKEESSVTRVHIAANSINFWEADGRLLHAKSYGTRVGSEFVDAVTGVVATIAEGQPEIRGYTLYYSKKPDRLGIQQEGVEKVWWLARCK